MGCCILQRFAASIATTAVVACGGQAVFEGEPGEGRLDGQAKTSDVSAASGGTLAGETPETGGAPSDGGGTWSGKIAGCCWLEGGCRDGETCVASSCWSASLGCWADEDCSPAFHCEGASTCSCCETCRCTGPNTAGTCVLNTCTVAEGPPPDLGPDFDECASLGGLVLGDPQIVDDGNDGLLSAGERAVVTVAVHETSGYPFSSYPGVQIEVDPTVASATALNWRYSHGACESIDYSASVEFSHALTPGTEITLTARIAALNIDCPEAPSIEIPVVIVP